MQYIYFVPMPIQISHISNSKKLFDLNIEYFFKPSDLSSTGWETMSDAEKKVFKETNFAVGYCGSEIALSTWSSKNCRGLTNLNFMQESSIEEKRQYLWDLINFNFDEINKIEDRKRRRDLRRDNGYYFLRYYQTIAETSKNYTVNLWYLSKYDLPTACLIEKFLNYLANTNNEKANHPTKNN